MHLLPIEKDMLLNEKFAENTECASVLSVYPDFYSRVGFNKPWIGYFASIDDGEIVGCGGYKGPPQEGKVEIAYYTFKEYEAQGFGTAICQQLVSLSLETDPSVRITARTLMEMNGSTTVLQRNGFKCLGIVLDKEDGNVWEWEFEEFIPG